MEKRKQVKLSIDEEIWKNYKRLCGQAQLSVNDDLKWFLNPSRRVEGFMKRDIEKINRQFGKKIKEAFGDKDASDTREKNK
jgi:hypothetical protein